MRAFRYARWCGAVHVRAKETLPGKGEVRSRYVLDGQAIARLRWPSTMCL